MECKEECFERSPLKTEMGHTNKVVSFYKQVKSAYSSYPNSKFWKEAFEFIEKRYKKLKK